MKTVIIINGAGGVGKDFLCDVASEKYDVLNISSITPIKELAYSAGWDGAKDEKSRRFLGDLKKLLVEFNDYPTQYCMDKYEHFMHDTSAKIMFVHIREPEEIAKLKAKIPTKCITLLVKRDTGVTWGNEHDDNVEKYDYDYIYNNCHSLEDTPAKFMTFLNEILR